MSDFYLEKFKCENLRNLKDRIVTFSPSLNLIYGENGNGKTNLLEGIYLLTEKKSFRKNTSFPQFINIEGEKSEIYLQALLYFQSQQTLSLKIYPDSRETWINNKREKKLPSNWKSLFVNPFDAHQFFQSSQFRRAWLDNSLSLVDENYRKILAKFTKILKQRNALLGYPRTSSNQLQLYALDEIFCTSAVELDVERFQLLGELNKLITPTFKVIFQDNHELKLTLQGQTHQWDIEKLLKALKESEIKDFSTHQTHLGPHRDTPHFLFDGFNAVEYCSLGQQKMSFMALQFAIIELFRYKNRIYPIVLIDDVSGELDYKRWQNLMQYLNQSAYQVILTTANRDFRSEFKKSSQVHLIEMNQGACLS
jgi:DNA replication and repair protein RecF